MWVQSTGFNFLSAVHFLPFVQNSLKKLWILLFPPSWQLGRIMQCLIFLAMHILVNMQTKVQSQMLQYYSDTHWHQYWCSQIEDQTKSVIAWIQMTLYVHLCLRVQRVFKVSLLFDIFYSVFLPHFSVFCNYFRLMICALKLNINIDFFMHRILLFFFHLT